MPNSPEDSDVAGLGRNPGIFDFSKAVNSAAQPILLSTFLRPVETFPAPTFQDSNITQKITENLNGFSASHKSTSHLCSGLYVLSGKESVLIMDITRGR